jgi:hypothetical protein
VGIQKQEQTRTESAARRVGAALGRMAARVDRLTGRNAKPANAAVNSARTARPRTQAAAERRAAQARTEPVKRRMLSEETRARNAEAQTHRRLRPKARMG